MLSWNEIEDRAVKFQKHWKNCEGNERQQAQTFEKDFMNIFGVDWKDGFHEHPITLKDGSIGYIDYFIPGKILIEMKSKGKSLTKAYTEAMKYVHSLKAEEVPVLVVVSDFDKMQVYNLEKSHRYNSFKVSQIKKYIRTLGFLAGYDTTDKEKAEIELNTDASYKMAELHDILKENGYNGHNLEIYLVRLLFCLFAEDTGIFEKYSFRDYIKASEEDGSNLDMRLMALFNVLNTSLENRMNNLSPELKRFRYINGNLFKEDLPLASFNKDMRNLLLECCMFNWSEINPAIFGAIFQGVMDQDARRNLGAHYTSEKNIMKVLNPLFLDELYDEFERSKSTVKELKNFQLKLSSLKFLDPACGSGNFLLIAYQRIRELEFEVMKMIYDHMELQMVGVKNIVHINQFYGIEYEEFSVEIAKVSMILMKHLIDQQISNYFGFNIIDFPIKENVNIINDNALSIDWNKLIEAKELNYIIGNPPFVGHQYRNKQQQKDMDMIFSDKGYKKLDYVCAWYKKAFDYIKSNKVYCAFVSTNSMVQGEQAGLMTRLYEEYNIAINYAYRTFIWKNEAKYNAAVHCIIIGFSNKSFEKDKKIIIEGSSIKEVSKINAYLLDSPNIIIKTRSRPLSKRPKISKGSQATDGNNLIFTESEYIDFIEEYPEEKGLLKRYMGSNELINNINRYCLWIKEENYLSLRKNKEIISRLKRVKESRLNSKTDSVRRAAITPYKFTQIRQPSLDYLAIPAMSSGRRKYLPIGYLSKDIIANSQLYVIPEATLYIFGILSSKVHNEWMKIIAGRLKSDFRYAPFIYNNFPLPNVNIKTKNKVAEKGELILKIRANYKDWGYADLYDPLFMPMDLLKAHNELDRVVWEAYGKAWNISSEKDCVAYLMKLYNDLVGNEDNVS